MKTIEETWVLRTEQGWRVVRVGQFDHAPYWHYYSHMGTAWRDLPGPYRDMTACQAVTYRAAHAGYGIVRAYAPGDMSNDRANQIRDLWERLDHSERSALRDLVLDILAGHVPESEHEKSLREEASCKTGEGDDLARRLLDVMALG